MPQFWVSSQSENLFQRVNWWEYVVSQVVASNTVVHETRVEIQVNLSHVDVENLSFLRAEELNQAQKFFRIVYLILPSKEIVLR